MGIDSEDGRHEGQMADGQLATTDGDRASGFGPCERSSRPSLSSPLAAARIRYLVDAHFDFVWRSLRRMGLSGADSDDAAQEVFTVAARRLCDIRPGRERAFLFGTALRVASQQRRRSPARRERLDDRAEAYVDPQPSPEQLLEKRRARQQLDELLDELPLEQRAVFVLYELEQLTAPEIAALLELPLGTVASRLRRARAGFEASVARLRARQQFKGRSS